MTCRVSNQEVSSSRIERLLPSIPWHPRILYSDTERKLRRVKYRNPTYRLYFLFVGMVSNLIHAPYPTPIQSAGCAAAAAATLCVAIYCCCCCCCVLLRAAAARCRTPATRGRSSYKQQVLWCVVLTVNLFLRRKYFSTPLCSKFAFVRPRLLHLSWLLRAFAEPQADVIPATAFIAPMAITGMRGDVGRRHTAALKLH